MDDFELAMKLFRDGGENIALLESHVGGKIVFGGEVSGGVIEAMKAPGLGLVPSKFEEPASITERLARLEPKLNTNCVQ